MHDPLVWVYDILAKVYRHFQPDALFDNGVLPKDMVEYSFDLYLDKDTQIKLKIKILEVLQAILEMVFTDLHFDFARKDFYIQLKYDFLFEHVTQKQIEEYEKFFIAIADFLGSLLEFNDSETNVSICEDLEFDKMLMEFMVNNKFKQEVVFDHQLLYSIFKLVTLIAKYTPLKNVLKMMMDKSELHVFNLIYEAVKSIPPAQQWVMKAGLECIAHLLELETLETSSIQSRLMYKKLSMEQAFIDFLEKTENSDSVETIQLKLKLLRLLAVK